MDAGRSSRITVLGIVMVTWSVLGAFYSFLWLSEDGDVPGFEPDPSSVTAPSIAAVWVPAALAMLVPVRRAQRIGCAVAFVAWIAWLVVLFPPWLGGG